MNRRNFLKVFTVGAATFFLSGFGLNAVTDEKNVHAQKNISEGKILKIVLINSSLHSEEKSTSRFLAQKNIPVIPKSVHVDRMKENFNIFDFELSLEEILEIEKLDEGKSLFG